jgi:myo-inositol-1(or 4)-monophosphatase
MHPPDKKRALSCAVAAAKAAGALMRANFHSAKKVNTATSHDIKLELDVRCQKTIECILRRAFPGTAILGEEGVIGNPNAGNRWVVDPIDGTVNFAYGIPHACVSIALQTRGAGRGVRGKAASAQFETVVGVVYDPFQDELWTAISGQRARLNGKPICASAHSRLSDAIVTVGFAKSRADLEANIPHFLRLARCVRKIRIMGSAGLGLTYVASGRFDAYIERGIQLWDIAAGGLIVECAGGRFWCKQNRRDRSYHMIASSKAIWKHLPHPA